MPSVSQISATVVYFADQSIAVTFVKLENRTRSVLEMKYCVRQKPHVPGGNHVLEMSIQVIYLKN